MTKRFGRHPVAARAALAALLCLLPVSLFGYIREITSGGTPLRRTDSARIEFLQNQAIRAGLKNNAGDLIVTADSDPGAALRSALSAWGSLAVSSARFAPVQTTTLLNDPRDGKNVFVMADTAEVRSLLQGALAVTVLQYFTDGRLTDTDILYSPDITSGSRRYLFSTTLASGTYDLQSVTTHELGHALGADHTGVVGAVMFPVSISQAAVQSRPREDDISFLADAYPAGGASYFGTLSGAVRLADGTPVRGALVAALDPDSGAIVGGMTSLADGSYKIARIPPGKYMVLAEPADNPFLPEDLALAASRINSSFGTAILGGFDSPQMIDIPASGSAIADVTVSASKTLNPIALGIGSAGGSGDGRGAYSSMPVPAGRASDVLLWAEGADVSRVSVRLLGPGLSLRSGTVRSDPGFTMSGLPAIRFTVDVGSAAGLGTVLISQGDAIAVYTGGLAMAGTPPQFTSRGVANSAGFAAAGVAPGEIVSIYGTGLGPAAGMQNGGLEPSTGGLPTDVGNVSVMFDNQFAPMFYTSSGQVNLQVPYEVSGRTATNIVIRLLDAVSSAVSVPVVAAAPGVFAVAGSTQGIVFNQDGTLNGASNPAARGTYVTIYATGLGNVNPAVGTGLPAPFSPLSYAQAPTVTVGGVAANVYFGGLTPGFAGLFQLNAMVPSGAPTGGSVELRVGAAGAVSPAGVTVAVK
jgi:uncharacterized protein (TIGR03437 family)